jgi:hypothetical protein
MQFCYSVRVDFENKPSDAERLQRIQWGHSFARFMAARRRDYLERVAVEDAKFLREIGAAWPT